MRLSEFNKNVSSLSQRVKSNVKASLYAEVELLRKDLVERSPKDSGYFASNWSIMRVGTRSGLASMSVRNQTPYAVPLDLGAKKGGPPWHFPRSTRTVGGTTSRSNKLILANGRVWAGGLSPSGFVVGGIIDPVIYYNYARQLKMADVIADSVVAAL